MHMIVHVEPLHYLVSVESLYFAGKFFTLRRALKFNDLSDVALVAGITKIN